MSLPERIAKIQNHAERVEEEIEVLRKRLRTAEVRLAEIRGELAEALIVINNGGRPMRRARQSNEQVTDLREGRKF